MPVFADLEKTYSCSGLCTKNKYYVYSDVNKGPPLNTCEAGLKDYITSNFYNYGVGFSVMSVWFFVCWFV
jgi:hypothetical protein